MLNHTTLFELRQHYIMEAAKLWQMNYRLGREAEAGSALSLMEMLRVIPEVHLDDPLWRWAIYSTLENAKQEMPTGGGVC